MTEAVILQEMTIADYDEVFSLWDKTEGIGLNESDTRESVALYLLRNPGMSFVARNKDGELAGAVLCGHDGRRGYLYHLAVAFQYQKKGIARKLIAACFKALERIGIHRCSITIFATNRSGQAFWEHNGWQFREDLRILQRSIVVK